MNDDTTRAAKRIQRRMEVEMHIDDAKRNATIHQGNDSAARVAIAINTDRIASALEKLAFGQD